MFKIPKPETEVKGKDAREKSIREAQESYHKMMRETRDPGNSNAKYPYRLRVGVKYWDDVLAGLTGPELKVFLHYRVHADWQTGEAVRGLRKMSEILKMDKNTTSKARQSLVQKGFLEKTRKAVRCSFYKILKV